MIAIPERYNASVLIDRNLERGLSEKTAIICGDERVSYGELARRINRFAIGLRGLGLRREERVMLALLDTPAFPVAFLGAMRIGAVPIPVNTLLSADEYRYMLEDSYARVVVTDAELLPKIQAAVSSLTQRPIIVVNGPGEGDVTLADLLDSGADEL